MSPVGVKKMAPRCDNCGKQGKIMRNSGGKNWGRCCLAQAPAHDLEIPEIEQDPRKIRWNMGERDNESEESEARGI